MQGTGRVGADAYEEGGSLIQVEALNYTKVAIMFNFRASKTEPFPRPEPIDRVPWRAKLNQTNLCVCSERPGSVPELAR